MLCPRETESSSRYHNYYRALQGITIIITYTLVITTMERPQCELPELKKKKDTFLHPNDIFSNLAAWPN